MEIIAVIIVLSVIILIEYKIYDKLVLRNIEYRLYISKSEVFEGETVEIVEEVVNKKRLPVPWLKSEICTSRWLEFPSSKVSEISDSRFVPSVFALKPYQKCTRTRKVRCLKRGIFRLSDTSIVASDIFGFVQKSMKVSVSGVLTVLPSPHGVQMGDLSRREYFGELAVRRFVCEDPFVISGVRESTGREPMNKVHWNSTARNNKLMVFNNEYTTTNRTLIVINMGKSSEGRLRPILNSELETYIKATAFLLDVFSQNGSSAAFAANGSEENGIFVPLGSTNEYFHGILRRLSAIENTCSFDICTLFENIRAEEYTDIVIFSNYVSDELAELAGRINYEGVNVYFYSNDDKDIGVQTVPIGRVNIENAYTA